MFDFEPEVVKAGRVMVVVGRIERWLEWTSGQRVCAPGIDQLCLEPGELEGCEYDDQLVD